jgi:hypothetical protein
MENENVKSKLAHIQSQVYDGEIPVGLAVDKLISLFEQKSQ